MDQNSRATDMAPTLNWEREQSNDSNRNLGFAEALPEMLEYVERSDASNKSNASALSLFGRGFIHGAIQRPVNGVTEIVNHTFGSQLPELSLVDTKDFKGSLAAVAGIGAGSLVPMTLTYTAASPFIRNPILRGAVAGGFYGGILTPATNDGTNFFVERAAFAAAGACFGAMAGSTHAAWRGEVNPGDVPDVWGYYRSRLGPLVNPDQWRGF